MKTTHKTKITYSFIPGDTSYYNTCVYVLSEFYVQIQLDINVNIDVGGPNL